MVATMDPDVFPGLDGGLVPARVCPIRDGEDVSVDSSAAPDRSTDKPLKLGVKKRITAGPPKDEFTLIAL